MPGITALAIDLGGSHVTYAVKRHSKYDKRPAVTISQNDRDCACGWTELIDMFASEGFTKAEVDRVLDGEIEEAPTLRDRLTSRMANELMKGLGMPGRQSPEDVRRVRLGLASGHQGTWSAGEKPPGHT